MLYRFLAIALLSLAMVGCTSDDPVVLPDEPQQETPSAPSDTTPEDPAEPTPELPDDPKYHIIKLSIDTEKGSTITSKKDYVKCTVTIDADNDEWDFTASAGIRGRGNSSWLWYDKKPYRIKLDKKASLLGLGEGKSWALLANFRDPTDLMNTFVFELGQLCGLPYSNNTRYVELTLNGKYNGLYQLTEQVQQGKGRVNISETEGYLLSLDVDDGPAEAPNEGDNFWSEVYDMPVCVKNPENLDRNALMRVRGDFALLEKAIKDGNYALVKDMMDITSYMDFIMIQELVYNVELDAPRSMYIHKDVGGKWTMGPLWDFDGGYDFDWSSMYTGHTYFSDYRETVLGTDPVTHAGTGYRVPGFFSDLFKIKEFVADYKMRWRQVSALVPQAWENTMRYVDYDAWQREYELWPISKRYDNEIKRMDSWIQNRTVYMSNIISNYP